MSKIDWRAMFKGVLSRMRDAGESNEMGARWMATEAEAAVYALTAERDRLREALQKAEPYVEICHSLMTGTEPRKSVWTVLKLVRAALSTVEDGK
jgi:hypothetical protein